MQLKKKTFAIVINYLSKHYVLLSFIFQEDIKYHTRIKEGTCPERPFNVMSVARVLIIFTTFCDITERTQVRSLIIARFVASVLARKNIFVDITEFIQEKSLSGARIVGNVSVNQDIYVCIKLRTQKKSLSNARIVTSVLVGR